MDAPFLNLKIIYIVREEEVFFYLLSSLAVEDV